jgi:hypothetical protein
MHLGIIYSNALDIWRLEELKDRLFSGLNDDKLEIYIVINGLTNSNMDAYSKISSRLF